MNNIKKIPLSQLGYEFIASEFLPNGENEYYLRNLQNRTGIDYRHLTAYEIEVLVRNRNTSDNWNNLLVSDSFNPELVKNCKFYGLVRIGKLEPFYLEFSQLRVPVGLYNSTIISCDFGDNVVVDNVNYMSHYILGNEVIVVNVNELITTPHAKFGNGIVKEGEQESVGIWIELCNENGGRRVIPFVDMQPGDAWLWTRYRNRKKLMEEFVRFTQEKFDTKRGYYGKVGDRTVIKNCAILKDVWIGSDAYLKGANKLKNLTIHSSSEARSQIGEGCEIVNGIVGYGCRIFYGVKAVRFIMASNSQLKYGARLINSYLGNNATISCCEVLNSLIFPAHEQHHNNSFLCAALIMGQSNMAAGATIGSNHNSRSADGEMIAGRGFWPGLCVSLKHNSRFASFTIIAKGDYNYELDIPIPFSLVSQDTSRDTLNIMPAYWFRHNMYALARNAWKYTDRDKRPEKLQRIEFHYLAPDTVNEMFTACRIIETCVGRAWFTKENQQPATEAEYADKGLQLLHEAPDTVRSLEVLMDGAENSRRKVVLLKAAEGWMAYRNAIKYYAAAQLFQELKKLKQISLNIKPQIRPEVLNVGGQLVSRQKVEQLIDNIESGHVDGWEDVHAWYAQQGELYDAFRLEHAYASLFEVAGIDAQQLQPQQVEDLLNDMVAQRKMFSRLIVESRSKDHASVFRKMMYDSQEEMDEVLGSFEDNSFIKADAAETETLEAEVQQWLHTYREQMSTAGAVAAG